MVKVLFAEVGVAADTPLDDHDATRMNADDGCTAVKALDGPSPSSSSLLTCIREIRLLRLEEEEAGEVELWEQ